jgi:putative methyltransferase (TIGR04325 family)
MANAPLPEWEYLPGGWPPGDARGSGWDHPSIAPVMTAALPDFIRIVTGTEPLGIYPLAPLARSESGHNVSMTFGYAVARAALGRASLSVLDWGGALGHYALMAQALVPELPLRYTIKDLPELCTVGRALMPWVSFETDERACLEQRYDLVVASASLSYSEHWQTVLTGLAQAATGFLFVTRISVVRTAPSFVVVQRPHSMGYQTEYLTWVFNRDELLAVVQAAGLTLERAFIAGPPTGFPGAPEAAETAGFLFKRYG